MERTEDRAGTPRRGRATGRVLTVAALLGLLPLAGCGLQIEPVTNTEASSRANGVAVPNAPAAGEPAPTPPLPPLPTPTDVPAGRVNVTVFGQQVYGLHPEMAERLQRAEAQFRSELAGEPPETWDVQSMAGYRTGSRGHSAGLAVDINFWRNPYLMHEAGEEELDRQLGPVYHRIARLMLGRDSVIPEKTNGGPIGPERTMRLYEQLREESRAMIMYFQLMQDRDALHRHLEAIRTPTPPTYWDELLPGGSTPTPEALQRQMMADYVTLSGRAGPPVPGLEYPEPQPMAAGDRPFAGDPQYRGPELGFLNLRRELVQALTDAGLLWGGTDFHNQSGDIMHFYLPVSAVEAAETTP